MQLKDYHCEVGEIRIVETNWAAECERRGTTLASASWSWDGAGAISDPSTSGFVAQVTLDPLGSGTLKCKATLGNGEVLCGWRNVLVTEVVDGAAPEDVVYLISAENDNPIAQE